MAHAGLVAWYCFKQLMTVISTGMSLPMQFSSAQWPLASCSIVLYACMQHHAS
jgi:hypothetical protein